ncbi:hypothetical protein GQ464_004175 [Rhodocaloribacter litoris]|uniref:hypothetical protein n=1 Tax=Rhodocaloribacter litoris TaxID=2558931 RepID=UPI00141F23FF|nr:hypothetical protein [Rhodocaloribacter litoris]QXD16156.1 hypothetical protein GQ464_004175 [Rhodocaloribacter litoris]
MMNDVRKHCYRCYGLEVASELALPELVEIEPSERVDVVIRYDRVSPLPTPRQEDGSWEVVTTSEEIHFWMHGIGGLVIRSGCEMIIDPAPGAMERGFRFLVSGIGMGFVLHQRGIPSLHGAAVAIDGVAVGFVGWKGMGKSTTTAAFHRHGHPVLTDDVLPVVLKDGEVQALPAFPGLKLLPDAVEAVGLDDPARQVPISPLGTKRLVTVRDRFVTEALPLACVYVLDWHEEPEASPRVEPIPAREACVELMRHSFALRMFGEQGATPQHLAESARLAQGLPVRRLRRPRDLSRLDELVELVRADVAARMPEAVSASGERREEAGSA